MLLINYRPIFVTYFPKVISLETWVIPDKCVVNFQLHTGSCRLATGQALWSVMKKPCIFTAARNVWSVHGLVIDLNWVGWIKLRTHNELETEREPPMFITTGNRALPMLQAPTRFQNWMQLEEIPARRSYLRYHGNNFASENRCLLCK